MAQVAHWLEKRFIAGIPRREQVGHVEVAETCGDSDCGGDSYQNSIDYPVMRSLRADHIYVIGASVHVYKKERCRFTIELRNGKMQVP